MRLIVCCSVVLVFALIARPAWADDWTVDGTVFKNVAVVSHNDGYVTILDEDGGARIKLSDLPPAVRRQFGYDQARAAACVAATEQADVKEALAAEHQTGGTMAAPKSINAVSDCASFVPSPTIKSPATLQPRVAAQPQPPSDQMSDQDRQSLKEQIASLQGDISLMQGQEAKLGQHASTGSEFYGSAGGGHQVSHGAYDTKIQEEQHQITDLQSALASGIKPAITNQPPLTSGNSFANVPRL